jgi:hypothetical protein
MDPLIYFKKEMANIIGCFLNGAVFGFYAFNFDGEVDVCYASEDSD